MHDHPAAAPAAPPRPAPGDPRRWWQKRRFLLPATALIAFWLGAGAGSDSSLQQDLDEAEAEIGRLETERPLPRAASRHRRRSSSGVVPA